MIDGSDDSTAWDCSLTMGENQRDFVRALHESTAIADRIRDAIADAPPKLVMLALSDLLQEHLTRLVMVEPDREQTSIPNMVSYSRGATLVPYAFDILKLVFDGCPLDWLVLFAFQ